MKNWHDIPAANGWVNFHNHTTFSFQDGYGTPEQHVHRAAELGQEMLAVSDHGNISAHVQLEKAAKKAGIKPIFGCEFYGVKSISENSQKKFHLTVFAENQIGYQNLLKLVTRSFSDAKGEEPSQHAFYYRQTIDGEMLTQHREGLVVLSGCLAGPLASRLLSGASVEEGVELAETYKSLFGRNYYIELQVIGNLEATGRVNDLLSEVAERARIPIIATRDSHYLTQDQVRMNGLLHAIRDGGTVFDDNVALADLEHLSAGDLLYRARAINPNVDWESAMANAVLLGERCTVALPRAESLRFDTDNPEVLLEEWIGRGIVYRFGGGGLNAEYAARVDREVKIITEKGFVHYFLVIADMVRWAKEQGILVGPGRGSVAGSLVSYLLGITEVDPIPHKLFFERFIDVTREDIPDVDLDFQDDRRDEVKDYLRSKYGDDRVANIGTFTTYKGPGALRAVQKAARIPNSAIDPIKQDLEFTLPGDEAFNNTISRSLLRHPEIAKEYPRIQLAADLEGQYGNWSTHAAGVVVSERPLTEMVAIYERNGEKVISADKKDAEYLNLMKIDALSLSTLTMIARVLKVIGMTSEELYNVPLDDPVTLEGFTEQDLLGIFQFEGGAMRNVLRDLVPIRDFRTLVDINALSRPGPLQSGSTADYVKAYHGRTSISSVHPLYDNSVADTFGQMIYQEQVMQVLRDMGGFGWGEVTSMRRTISKKGGMSEFWDWWPKFSDAASSRGVKSDTARWVFEHMATHGLWSFNLAHSVSYTLLGWYTMYLKQHHPQEFYWSSLVGEGDEGRMRSFVKEATSHGIKVLGIDANRSESSWTLEGSGIRQGFETLKGLGWKAADKIVAERRSSGRYDGPEDFRSRLPGRAVNRTVMRVLEEAGAFDESLQDPLGLREWEGRIRALTRSHSSTELDGVLEGGYCQMTGYLVKKHVKDVIFQDGMEDHELNLRCVLTFEDENGRFSAHIGRYKLPEWREVVDRLKPGELFTVSGTKIPGFTMLRLMSLEQCA
jgi:DNA polymerase-3 subunit alpha